MGGGVIFVAGVSGEGKILSELVRVKVFPLNKEICHLNYPVLELLNIPGKVYGLVFIDKV